MSPAPKRDWQAVAEAKLTAVLGATKGEAALKDAMRTAQVERIVSADDLHGVAQALIATGGFAGAVGGLLSVHAVLYGMNEAAGAADTAPPPPPPTTSRAGG